MDPIPRCRERPFLLRLASRVFGLQSFTQACGCDLPVRTELDARAVEVDQLDLALQPSFSARRSTRAANRRGFMRFAQSARGDRCRSFLEWMP